MIQSNVPVRTIIRSRPLGSGPLRLYISRSMSRPHLSEIRNRKPAFQTPGRFALCIESGPILIKEEAHLTGYNNHTFNWGLNFHLSLKHVHAFSWASANFQLSIHTFVKENTPCCHKIRQECGFNQKVAFSVYHCVFFPRCCANIGREVRLVLPNTCLLYTSDAADE